jgi:spore germination cell wall hydrolase CwlJ-like protein
MMVLRTNKGQVHQSIILIFVIAGLYSIFAHVAAATESIKGHGAAVTSVHRNAVGGSGEWDLQRELSPQQENRIEDEVRCLALNIYFEARSEPEQGQLAVAHVVMNRVADRYYPSTACKVVQQGGEDRLYRCQFSWWCDGQSDTPSNQKAWLKSVQLAITVFFGHSEDPTNGALWYHADYAKPYWSDSLVLGSKIGQHIFYLKKEQPKYAFK